MKVEEVAPYPKSAEEATAEAMARYSAAFAQSMYKTIMRDIESEPAHDIATASGLMVDHFCNCLILREFRKAAPEAADAAAREMWTHCHFGDSIGEWLWEWLTEWGIDPASIDAPSPTAQERLTSVTG